MRTIINRKWCSMSILCCCAAIPWQIAWLLPATILRIGGVTAAPQFLSTPAFTGFSRRNPSILRYVSNSAAATAVSSASRHFCAAQRVGLHLAAATAAKDSSGENRESEKPKNTKDKENYFPSNSSFLFTDQVAGLEGTNVTYVDLEIWPHRPLGCTVEESLENPDFCFISAVKPDGNAAKAGIQVGDVILAISDLFGSMQPAVSLGLDKLQGYVKSCNEKDPLRFRMARGSTILERHEKALVDLCTAEVSADDKEIENCILQFLSSGYDTDVSTYYGQEQLQEQEEKRFNGYSYEPLEKKNADPATTAAMDKDSDDSSLMDKVYSLWAEDLPPIARSKDMPAGSMGASGQSVSAAAQKVKPWSSRSSPSGTYVRDPVTGEMKNIDA